MKVEISPPELKALLDNKAQIHLIDVRETWERSLVNIGGEHIPMSFLSNIEKSFAKTSHIILYCHHGVRSLMAANYLLSLGFAKVQSLHGGIDAWTQEIDSKVTRY